MKNWWDAPEWADRKGLVLPNKPQLGCTRRLALTTDPVIERGVLRLENRHPHERVHIYTGPRRALQC